MKRIIVAFYCCFFVFVIILLYLLLSKIFSLQKTVDVLMWFVSFFYICQIGIFGKNKPVHENKNVNLKSALQIHIGMIISMLSIGIFCVRGDENLVYFISGALGVFSSGLVHSKED